MPTFSALLSRRGNGVKEQRDPHPATGQDMTYNPPVTTPQSKDTVIIKDYKTPPHGANQG
jgi:hypothetical protein